MRVATWPAAVFACSSLAAPVSTWMRLESGRFEVYSDAGEKETRAAARALTSVSAVYSRLLGELPSRAPVVRLVLFRREEDFRKFRDSPVTRGFYQSSPERDYLVMPATGPEGERVLRHELVHVYLAHTTGTLPQWMEEGLAEFFSTIEIRANSVRVGRVVDAHVNLLARSDWIAPREFLRVTKGSEAYGQVHQAGIFYAQSWALVHMLQHARPYQGRIAALSAVFGEGLSPEEAFRKTYGITSERVFQDLHAYVAGRRFTISETPVPAAPEVINKGAAVETLDEVQASILLAELHSAVGNPDAAREVYARLANTSVSHELDRDSALGFIALQLGNRDLSIQRFQDSVRAGSRNASVYFELAMLLRERRTPDQEIQPLLERAVTLNPSFAEAWYQLGMLQSRQREYDSAIDSLKKAASVLPRQSPFWQALAVAYLDAGSRDQARQAALRSVHAALNQTERQSAEGVLREIDLPPRAVNAPARPAVQTPAGWQARRGDAFVDGILINVNCAGTTLTFAINSSGERLDLLASDPSSIRVNGATAPKEFACGPQRSAKVRAEYMKASRELIAIEFQ